MLWLWAIGALVAWGAVSSGGGGAAASRPKVKAKGTWQAKGPPVQVGSDSAWGPWHTATFDYEGTAINVKTGQKRLPSVPPAVGVAAAAIPVVGLIVSGFIALWNGIVAVMPKKTLITTSDGEMRGVAVWASAQPALHIEAELTWGETTEAAGQWGPARACAMQLYDVSVADAAEAIELPFEVEEYGYDGPDQNPHWPAGTKHAFTPENDESICYGELPSNKWIAAPGPETPRLFLVRTGNTWSLTIWIPGRHMKWWYQVRWRTRAT